MDFRHSFLHSFLYLGWGLPLGGKLVHLVQFNRAEVRRREE